MLWAGLERLRKEWAFDKADLVTFMCDGVAKRLWDPEMWEGLERLRKDWKFDKPALIRFVRNGGAKRLTPRFAEAAGQAIHHLDSLGLDGHRMFLAALSNNAAMFDAVPKLRDGLQARTTAASAEAYLLTFHGNYRHKTQMARSLLER